MAARYLISGVVGIIWGSAIAIYWAFMAEEKEPFGAGLGVLMALAGVYYLRRGLKAAKNQEKRQ